VEGFQYLPVLATPANPEYLPHLLMREGYSKEVDCVSYRMEVLDTLPERHERVIERIRRQNHLQLVEFTSRRSLKPFILPVLQLVNETYGSLFGFVPMSEPEMKKFATQYLPVLDPEFVKVVVNKTGDVKAFVVAMPDMSRGIQKAKGRLFPFGFLYVLGAMRNSRQLNMMLGAVHKSLQGKGVTTLLAKALLASARKRKMSLIDTHLILENNLPMRGEYEKLNGKVYKRFRIFSKSLV
jgi:GNAT superfamily N-acetyltransferase